MPQDPEEDDLTQRADDDELKLENDILRLKIQAEFGAQFSEVDSELSPEMEQQFLKQVYEFEQAWEKQEVTTVATLIGNPSFSPLGEIAAEDLQLAYDAALKHYTDNNISVDFNNEYPLHEKYRFIAEELPQHETIFVNMPGMMLGFIYEEFHPNHAADMEELAREFVAGWFDRNADKCAGLMSDQLITEDGKLLSRESVKEKLTLFFENFVELQETEIFIAETSYDKQEEQGNEQDLLLGYVEGALRCNAILENGDTMNLPGPFKLYMENVRDYWTIINFIMPGWKWL